MNVLTSLLRLITSHKQMKFKHIHYKYTHF